MIQRAKIPIPPSTNNLYKNVGSRRVKTDSYHTFAKHCAIILKMAMKPVTSYPVSIRLTIFGSVGFPVSRDVANCEKIATDALVNAGIIKDDNRKHVWDCHQAWRPTANPDAPAYCILEVCPIDPLTFLNLE